jgi:hypothetical protein
MDNQSALQKYSQLAKSIGKAGLHSMFPNDFEYYMVALELTTYYDDTIDYFMFPIMPKQLTKTENNRINVKNSASAVNVLMSKAFTPNELVIKGNFGRTFKILIDLNHRSAVKAYRFSINAGVRNAFDLDEGIVKRTYETFDPVIKTGYGCTKILQAIINKASAVDDKGRPFKLYFYNPALGETYLVTPTTQPLSFVQNESQNNMIWEYTLNLNILSEISGSIFNLLQSSTTSILAADNIRKSLTANSALIKNYIRSKI